MNEWIEFNLLSDSDQQFNHLEDSLKIDISPAWFKPYIGNLLLGNTTISEVALSSKKPKSVVSSLVLQLHRQTGKKRSIIWFDFIVVYLKKISLKNDLKWFYMIGWDVSKVKGIENFLHSIAIDTQSSQTNEISATSNDQNSTRNTSRTNMIRLVPEEITVLIESPNDVKPNRQSDFDFTGDFCSSKMDSWKFTRP